MREYKPCPFCGSSNIEVVNNNTCDGFAECYCRCRNCWAQSGGALRIGGQDTYNLAVKQWNNRPLEEEKIYTEEDCLDFCNIKERKEMEHN